MARFWSCKYLIERTDVLCRAVVPLVTLDRGVTCRYSRIPCALPLSRSDATTLLDLAPEEYPASPRYIPPGQHVPASSNLLGPR